MELSSSVPVSRNEASAVRGLFAAVHSFNVPVFSGALVTGVLLFSPALRAALMSGYSESIRGMHRWLGRGQIGLALAIAVVWMWAGCCEAEDNPGRLWRAWRIGHTGFISAAALGFAATGIVMSSPSSYSLSIVDYSLVAHLWLTYLSCAVVGMHAYIALRHSHKRRMIGQSVQTGESQPSGI